RREHVDQLVAPGDEGVAVGAGGGHAQGSGRERGPACGHLRAHYGAPRPAAAFRRWNAGGPPVRARRAAATANAYEFIAVRIARAAGPRLASGQTRTGDPRHAADRPTHLPAAGLPAAAAARGHAVAGGTGELVDRHAPQPGGADAAWPRHRRAA